MPFTAAQVDQLLAAINPVRVMRDGKGNSHLPQQDVLAHLTRIFGFGGFDYEILSLDLVFEQPHIKNDGTRPDNRFDVCYKATMRLTVRDPDGYVVCRFEDGSTGDATNQKRADGHDLAMKSAISLAKKRCAIALGDQFGLSLYNKGQLSKLVGGTLVHPGKTDEPKDVQADLPESKSMGIDEVERPVHQEDESKPADSPPPPQENNRPTVADRARNVVASKRAPTEAEIEARAEELRARVSAATTREELQGIWKEAGALSPDWCAIVRVDAETKVAEIDKAAA
ncbi:Rad52/Rad22 family DNA repair protein [Nocardia wallacei]|uniref:Rad52/Rad22 family DNA repair protein n=1 Tax=Nocardia wallacei TaxID=480035 RepID=UPI002455EACB|nr:Rad52/Rad22 family DNA repair protein [Nocardia wallacei]